VSAEPRDSIEQRHGRDGEVLPSHLADRVPRFRNGSRVPGWDDAVDLTKGPEAIPDLATTPVPDDLRAEIEAHMAKYPDPRSAALPALAAAQRRYHWCSPEAIRQVAAVMRLTPAYLTAVATFYDMFDVERPYDHRVYVCTNISCSLNGGPALLERIEAQTRGEDEIQVRGFECLGACDIAPMASVDGIYVGPIDLDEVPELVDQIRAGQPPLPAKQLVWRRSADPGAAGTPGPPLAAGGTMPKDEDRTDVPAPYEQAPDPPTPDDDEA
jgi:NADH:ubiquinone oxidoreductase subunit E